MTETTTPNFEQPNGPAGTDETDINVRAYFSRMSDDRLREYDPSWPDEKLIEWDGNFRSNGALMLVCCERDVETDEYRQVIEEHIRLRNL